MASMVAAVDAVVGSGLVQTGTTGSTLVPASFHSHSENTNADYAFLVHSQNTLGNTLPPAIDNKSLARQRRRRTRCVLPLRLGRSPSYTRLETSVACCANTGSGDLTNGSLAQKTKPYSRRNTSTTIGRTRLRGGRSSGEFQAWVRRKSR